jgi:hypothetical protein
MVTMRILSARFLLKFEGRIDDANAAGKAAASSGAATARRGL